MTTNPPAPADPVLLCLAGAWLAAEALVILLVAALALLLTIAGWRPSQPPAVASPVAPTPVTPQAPALADRPVVELRRMARAAGLSRLARSGRRAELLQALAA